ncbi:hypothetical protein ACI77O_12930 [Pseudomonas tritici]|uniref:hypothetical protein n=1 Tax=Pseudomonas tritici TaxID=2745518 RepID=UPI00387A9C11
MTHAIMVDHGRSNSKWAPAMHQTIHPALADCKVVFAHNLKDFQVSDGCAVFNAPRPLLGKVHPCSEWCHGRFFTEVDLGDSFAPTYIQRNIALDARVVIAVSNADIVEMLLADNKYADRYREHSRQDQIDMLLPNLSKIQNLPYGEAMALLEIAQAVHACQ